MNQHIMRIVLRITLVPSNQLAKKNSEHTKNSNKSKAANDAGFNRLYNDKSLIIERQNEKIKARTNLIPDQMIRKLNHANQLK